MSAQETAFNLLELALRESTSPTKSVRGDEVLNAMWWLNPKAAERVRDEIFPATPAVAP